MDGTVRERRKRRRRGTFPISSFLFLYSHHLPSTLTPPPLAVTSLATRLRQKEEDWKEREVKRGREGGKGRREGNRAGERNVGEKRKYFLCDDWGGGE